MPYAELHSHSNFSLPRRCQPSRGAGRRGGPARPVGPGPHRPRRPLRRGALRGDGPGLRAALRLRRRAHPVRPRRAPPAHRRRPTRTGPTWWCWPATPRATPASAGPSPRPTWPGARRAGPILTLDAPGRPPRGPLADPDRVPQGGGARRPHRRGPGGRGPRARPPDRRASAASTLAVELWDHGDPVDTARNDALAVLAVGAGGGTGGHQQRPLRHPRPVPPGHRAGGRTGPADPRRARGVAAVLGHRLPAGRGRAAPALRPVARRGRAGRRAGAGVRLRPAAGGPAAPRLPRARGPHRADLAGRADPAGRHRPLRAAATPSGCRGLGADRPRARGDRRARVRRLLPHRVGHRRVLPAPRHLLPGSGVGRQLGRLLRPRHHQRRRRRARAAVRTVPLARPRRAARHRRRHRVGPARGGHPVRLRALRPPSRRPGGQRHHLPGPLGPPRRGQGPRPRPRGGRRLGQGGRQRASRSSGRDRPAAGSWPQLAGEVLDFPRHLGIHSGGMVICDRPVVEVCPVEWARMPGPQRRCSGTRTTARRSAWSSSTCSGWACSTPCTTWSTWSRDVPRGRRRPGPARPRRTPSTTCCAGPTPWGCSRWRAGPDGDAAPGPAPLLLRPGRSRWPSSGPGPSRANAVHPYIRRRNGHRGRSPTSHPLLEPALERTLGVPLFQEQLMQIAIDVAGFTPAEADELRQAMSAKRSGERMATPARPPLRRDGRPRRHRRGGRRRSTTALAAFANFGFPESHSVAFAHLVYSTRLVASCTTRPPSPPALLNAQPMGFWSPQSLVADAKRHGVVVRRPDVDRRAGRGHPRAGGRGRPRRRAREGDRADACGPPRARPRSAASGTRRPSGSRRAPVVGHGGPGAPGRGDPRPARGAGHRGRPRRPGPA